MLVRTKNYKLNTKTYVRQAMRNVLTQQWWVSLIAIAICLGYLWIPNIWWFIGTAIAVLLYLLFWWIQFMGVTQLEQGKMLFERMSYEITSQQILMKINPKQGMPIKWDQIKRARIGKDYFLLVMSKAQLLYFPFKIFNTDNERKFVESILKRKGLIK
jgi:hypothetical protein